MKKQTCLYGKVNKQNNTVVYCKKEFRHKDDHLFKGKPKKIFHV